MRLRPLGADGQQCDGEHQRRHQAQAQYRPTGPLGARSGGGDAGRLASVRAVEHQLDRAVFKQAIIHRDSPFLC